MTDRVHLFPRRKAGAGAVPVTKGRQPVELTRSAISAMFGMPQPHAARDLGISLTALKQVCRKLGIVRWPYMRSSKIYSKHGGRSRCPSGPVRAVECGVEIDPPARDGVKASGLRDDAQAQAQAQAHAAACPLIAPCHDAAAYQSDFEGSDASCYSADTEVARTSSTGSDFSDGDDEYVVHVELSQEAPARGGAQSDMGDDSDVSDDLGWLVSCQAEALNAGSQAELERAWLCLERCCQARKAAAGVERAVAQPECEWVPSPDPYDMM